jgi:hypothetical protein
MGRSVSRNSQHSFTPRLVTLNAQTFFDDLTVNRPAEQENRGDEGEWERTAGIATHAKWKAASCAMGESETSARCGTTLAYASGYRMTSRTRRALPRVLGEQGGDPGPLRQFDSRSKISRPARQARSKEEVALCA